MFAAKTRNFVLLILLFCISCQRDSLHRSGIADDLIHKSEDWFTSYLQKAPVHAAFANAIYHWEKARIFTFKNGYEVVTVPITEQQQNLAYAGQRILYLYPWKNGKGFYATVFEFLPDADFTRAQQGQFSLDGYSGLLLTWDIHKGFQRGLRWEGNLAIQRVDLEANKPVAAKENSTTDLPRVTVYASYPAPYPEYYYF